MLVNFPNRGGAEWAAGAGYRVEALFDIWNDLEMAGPAHPALPPRPAPHPGAPELPNGLSPAAVARLTAHYYVRHGWLPRPPARLDREHDAAGGVFVSFRRNSDDHRIARDGFWHFDPRQASLGRDLVAATAQTIDASAGGIEAANLDSLKIGITLLGRLEPILPSQLDFDRYGIVVRDRTFGTKRGGALPNTQVFIAEAAQYRHARARNARLGPIESHDLFRHTVTKHVEAGERWLPYGCPEGPEMDWRERDAIGAALTARSRAVALGAAGGVALDGRTVPCELGGVAVTLYRGGTIGAGIARGPGELDDLVCRAATRAARDTRAQQLIRAGADAEIAVAVTLLHDPESFVEADPRLVTIKIRRGRDAVTLERGDRSATLLPAALVYNNWSKAELTTRLRRLSGISGPPWRWTTHRTTAWIEAESGVHALRFGFPRRRHEERAHRSRTETFGAEIARLGEFLFRNLAADGVPAYYLDPVSDAVTRRGTAPRLLHGLFALDRAGTLLGRDEWREGAQRGLRLYLDDVEAADGGFAVSVGGPLADAVVLAGAGAAGHPLRQHPAIEVVARRLLSMLRPEGRISAWQTSLAHRQDHDYLPGAVLLALASYPRTAAFASRRLAPQLRWYRHRFANTHSWGMVGWQTQGWTAIHEHTSDAEQADFVFALADWAIDRQLEKNGAFLEDLSPEEPSFNTGFIAEGIAASWSLARRLRLAERARHYEASWRRAAEFMSTLTIRPEDIFCLRAGDRAVGGVRLMQTRSDVRVDAVSHWLHALIAGVANLDDGGGCAGA